MNTVVIGLGNPILTDDGVGIYAARMVRRALPCDAYVDVIELAVGGLQLMESMIGYDHVVIIDAVWSPHGETGRVIQFDAGHLPDTMNTASAHDADLPTALRVGRSLGAALPSDEGIQIVGVQAREVLTFGDRPTPPVVAALPEVVDRVLGLLYYPPVVDLHELTYQVVGGYDDVL